MSAQPLEILVAHLEGAYEQLDKRLGDLVSTIDARFAQVDRRFDALERRFDGRFDALDRAHHRHVDHHDPGDTLPSLASAAPTASARCR